jgi:hypothetical protein
MGLRLRPDHFSALASSAGDHLSLSARTIPSLRPVSASSWDLSALRGTGSPRPGRVHHQSELDFVVMPGPLPAGNLVMVQVIGLLVLGPLQPHLASGDRALQRAALHGNAQQRR